MVDATGNTRSPSDEGRCTEEFYQEDDLREELSFDGFDPALDMLTVWDGEQMDGFATLSVPRTGDHERHGRGYLSGGVRESHRSRGLGRALMDRLGPRAATLVSERHPGVASYLRVGGGLEGSSASRMLQRRGYRVVRYYNELNRRLEGGIEVPGIGGVRVGGTRVLAGGLAGSGCPAGRVHGGAVRRRRGPGLCAL